MMRATGQGAHTGLTVLRLGPGFEIEQLRSAVERLAEASPIAGARLSKLPLGVPRWVWDRETRCRFSIRIHASGEDWNAVGHRSVVNGDDTALVFDIVPNDSGTMIVFRWKHTLLDGKGAELCLAEIASLAASPGHDPQPGSWGVIPPKPKAWKETLGDLDKFKNHFYELAKKPICSVGGPVPHAGVPRFFVEEFTVEETSRITARAAEVSRGMFQIGWFLAAAMRAHRAVLAARGTSVDSFQAGCAVQERKRGARHPIWQNHVSQLFFSLPSGELEEHSSAAAKLQAQFVDMSRQRMEVAFAVMARFFRRLPAWFYLRMLRGNSGGNLTSFFFSHTGEFLPECQTFCGAPVEHGWHIPTVSQPPGTGIFFGQRGGKLTATFSWREGVLRDSEFELLRNTLRRDLLGA
jgi:hypothetical protein